MPYGFFQNTPREFAHLQSVTVLPSPIPLHRVLRVLRFLGWLL